MYGITVSMTATTRSSPAAAPSTSNPNHCDWGTSPARRLPSSTPNTPINALGYEACFRAKAARDRAQPIGLTLLTAARERLIERRDTHLSQLGDKLKEARGHRAIGRVLADTLAEDAAIPEDGLQYVEDLGLVRTHPQLAIANPIYREVIPRPSPGPPRS